jgi:hypothetical protein
MSGTGKYTRYGRGTMRYRKCGRVLSVVMLLSFLTIRASGEQRGTGGRGLEGGGTRYYSGSEVERLIEEVSEAAEAAIEQAAGEAARAAVLSSLDREAKALREAAQWEELYRGAKGKTVKAAVITGVVCFLSGFTVGAGTMLILQGGR